MRIHRSETIPALLALPLLLSVPALADDRCYLKKLGSMDAELTAGNQLLVKAEFGDVSIPMLFDTAAAWNAFGLSATARLGLVPDYGYGGNLQTMHERRAYFRTTEFAYPGSLSDGAAHPLGGKSVLSEAVIFDATSFYVFPDSGGGGNAAAGVLGAAARNDVDFEIDPTGGKINVFEPNHCTGRVVYWSDDYETMPYHVEPAMGYLEVPVELDGVKLTGVIDTGASRTVVPSGVAYHKLGIEQPEGEAADITLDAQPQTGIDHDVATLKIGDLTVHEVTVVVTQLRHDTDVATGTHIHRQSVTAPDVIIGMDVLRHLHLYIASREQVIYYTDAKAGRSATE